MCRSRRELTNEYLLAKIGVDTAENEPLEVWGKIQFTIHITPYSRLLRAPLLPSSWVERARKYRSGHGDGAGPVGDRADPFRLERDERRVSHDSYQPPRRARRARPGGEVPDSGRLRRIKN